MVRIGFGTVLRAILITAFMLLPIFFILTGAPSPTRIGKPDLTIYSADVDPLNIGPGVINYPEYYDPVEYRDQVTTMDFSEDFPNEGDMVQINLTVFNIGIEAGSGRVEFFDGPRENGTFIGSDNVSVNALDYDTATTFWNTLGVTNEEHEIFAYLSPNDPQNETNQGNNEGSEEILINFFPNAEITSYSGPNGPGEIFEGDEVSFDGSGTSDTPRDIEAGLTLVWDFRDIHSNETNPGSIMGTNFFNVTHVFLDAGEYLVDLTAIDQNGARSTDSILVKVGNLTPQPIMTIDKPSVMEDEIVLFRSDMTIDTSYDLSLMEYLWDFGDGTYFGWTRNTTIEHCYTRSGEYTILLVARDDDGMEGNAEASLHVSNSVPISKIESVSVNGVALDPSEDRIMVIEDDVISVRGNGMDTPSDIGNLRYSWYLEGSFLNREKNATISFPKRGIHFLELEVVDDDGNKSRSTLSIDVLNQAPIADAGPDLVLDTNRIVLNASGSRDTPSDLAWLSYIWDTGDGKTIEGRVVEYIFLGKGTFDIELTVIDDDGAVSVDQLRISVKNMEPKISLLGPAMVFEDEVFVLDASNSTDLDGTIVFYFWTIDETDQRSGVKIEYVFHWSGNHTVELRVVDDVAAESVLELVILVQNVAPSAEAGPDNESLMGSQITFDAHLSKDTPSDRRNLTFIWVIDGNYTFLGEVIRYVFDIPGEHIVELRVVDDDGAWSLDRLTAWVRNLTLMSISITLAIDPARCGPGDLIKASGRVDLEILEKGGSLDRTFVPIKIIIGNMTYLVKPDQDGSYSFEFKAPAHRGRYLITARLDRLGVTGQDSSFLEVDGKGSTLIVIVSSPLVIGVGASIVLLALGGGAALSTDIGRWKFFLLLVPLFSRLSKDQVLENFERGRIYQYILLTPGDHFSHIREMLGINIGTLTYHLTVLEREEYIRSLTDGRYKRFYPFGMKVEPDSHLDIQELILVQLIKNPGMSQKEIADAIGIHVSTVNYHINMMVGAGILSPIKKGQAQRYEVKYIAHEILVD